MYRGTLCWGTTRGGNPLGPDQRPVEGEIWGAAGPLCPCLHREVGGRKGRCGADPALEPAAWHCGKGHKGTANDTHVAVEICEDGLTDASYFSAVYQEAVELTAYLCRTYGLDPQADGVVICHSEGYRRGIASNHADVTHWWPRFGVTMDDFGRTWPGKCREVRI